ncbi:MAG: hypothetical protein DHS20C13_19500 [Thermodesulfobacteriota bacterium]|nr:MAG: hypothetical protein DHS20C13_19500 [Thermodesulfobacteriota bacterium]
MKLLLTIFVFSFFGAVFIGCDSGGDGGGFVPTGDILAVAERTGTSQTIKVGGTAGSVPPGSTVEVTNLSTSETKTTFGLADGSFDPTFTGNTNDLFNVLVTNNENVVIDIEIGVTLLRNAVERNLATLGSVPADIKIRGSRAYVINGFSNNIQIFELNQNPPQFLGTIVVPPGSNPISMDFFGNDQAYVANNIGQSVAVVNIFSGVCQTLIVSAEDQGNTQPCQNVINVPSNTFEEPAGVKVVNNKVYITNNNLDDNFNPNGNGFVTVLNTATNQVIGTINASGANTSSMVEIDEILYALNNGNILFDFDTFEFTCDTSFPPSIDIIDTLDDSVFDTIDIPLSQQNPTVCLPNNLTATSDGFGYTGLGLVGALLKVDLFEGTVINGTANPIIITDLSDLNNTADLAIKDGLLFTTLFNSDQIAVLDTSNDQVDPFPYITPFPAGLRGDSPNSQLFDGVQSLAIRSGESGVDFTGADLYFITGISEQLGSVDTTLQTQ